MTSYVAMLRGINVGGKNKVPMKDLQAAVAELGYDGVVTYISSGNLVFKSSGRATAIAAEIEHAIADAFRLDVPVIVRTRPELEKVVVSNPFLAAHPKAEASKLHVTFLADKPTTAAIATLDPSRSPPDEFVVRGREIFMRFPNGSGRSKLTNDYFERHLGMRATARNWRTVTTLLELAQR